MTLQPRKGGLEIAPTDYPGSLDPELARVVRICDPRFDSSRRLIFQSPRVRDELAAWISWGKTCFRPLLLPSICTALAHARGGEAREIQVLDGRLSASLSTLARERSTEAGRELLRSLANARAVGLITRMQGSVMREETPAHFPIVHALQCALFHIPRIPCLLSYLFFEWRAAHLPSPRLGFPAMIQSFLPVLAESASPSSDAFPGEAAA